MRRSPTVSPDGQTARVVGSTAEIAGRPGRIRIEAAGEGGRPGRRRLWSSQEQKAQEEARVGEIDLAAVVGICGFPAPRLRPALEEEGEREDRVRNVELAVTRRIAAMESAGVALIGSPVLGAASRPRTRLQSSHFQRYNKAMKRKPAARPRRRSSRREPIIQQRLRRVFELTDAMEKVFRQRMRNENPGISVAELEAKVRDWYLDRPGAEFGDGVGRPVSAEEFLRRRR